MSLLTASERAGMRGAIAGTLGDTFVLYTGSQSKSGNVRQAPQWVVGATLTGRMKLRRPVEALQAWGLELAEPAEVVLSADDTARVKADDRLKYGAQWYRVRAIRPPTGAGQLSGRLLVERARSLETPS